MFLLVEGYLPFCDRNPLLLYANIQTKELRFNSERWGRFASTFIEISESFLKRNPSERLSATDALTRLMGDKSVA